MVCDLQAFLVDSAPPMLLFDRPRPPRKVDVEVSPIAQGGLDPPMTDDGFSKRLKQLRKQKGLSQAELAGLVDVHYNHIGRYERATSRPSADALSRLADALGVSADYLFEGSNEDAARADFKDRELLRQFQEVEQLPDEDKDVIKKLLDAFLMKKKLQRLAAG